MAILIADASRYQGRIDWEKAMAAGIQGAILKTVSTNYTEFGGLYIDPTFEYNYAECKRLGIPVGAYYYTYAQDKTYADKELALFKKAIAGKTFEYPLVVDVEDNLLKPLSADALTDLVEYALQTIESWGCYAMVYTYLYYQNTELNMARLAKYDLWLAAYRDVRPTYPAHSIWQFTSSGKVNGISGNVDINYVYKDFPAIIKAAGLNGFAAEIESKLSAEPCRLIIGPASSGDRNTIGTKLTELGIDYTVTAEGCIITDKAVSSGDKKTMEIKCRQLEIGIEDYVETQQQGCTSCEELKAQLIIEQQYKEGYWQDVQRLTAENERLKTALEHEQEACNAHIDDNVELVALVDKLQAENESLKAQLETAGTNEELQAKLTAANRALSEQKRLNSELITAIKPLREQLNKIKDIVGG